MRILLRIFGRNVGYVFKLWNAGEHSGETKSFAGEDAVTVPMGGEEFYMRKIAVISGGQALVFHGTIQKLIAIADF